MAENIISNKSSILDCTDIDNYLYLTVDNFLVELISTSAGCNAKTSNQVIPELTYNGTTGTLTINNLGTTWNSITNNGYSEIKNTVNIWLIQ